MRVEDFELSAIVVDDENPLGGVQGAVHSDGGGLAYNVNLENIINVSILAYTRLSVKHDSQGQPIKIKAKVRPSTTVRRGNAYAVRVIVM